MKLFILCALVAAFAAVQAAPSTNPELVELLKKIENLLDKKVADREEKVDADKRYLYSNPKVDSSKPGQVWVDLQSVVEVEKDCPTCRLYVAYKCISPECHNKDVHFYPEKGYSWQQFKQVFIDEGNGAWVSGLENGMDYAVWDVVRKANGEIYPRYKNTDRRVVKIPA